MRSRARRGVHAAIVAVAAAALLVSTGAPALADAGDLPFTSTPAPSISYAPLEGDEAVATVPEWSPAPDDIELFWYADGTLLNSCSGSFYCPTPGDGMGESLSVTETNAKAGYATTSVTSNSVTILGRITPGDVTVTGTQQAGQTLTAHNANWEPSDVDLSYQWISQGTPITGATDSTFVLTDAQAGRTIELQVTATKAGYGRRIQSWRGDDVYPSQFWQPSDFIVGDDAVGATLSLVTPLTWYPAPDNVTYQWQRGGADIPGATTPTYVAQQSDVGQTIDLTSTASGSRLPTAVWTSSATPKIREPFDTVTTPSIAGTAEVGVALRAVVPAWSPAASSYDYVWLLNGVEAPFTGLSTYTPTAADLGKVVTLKVYGFSATRATTASPISTPSAQVIANPSVIGAVKLPRVDLNRLIKPSLPKLPSGANFSYQWLRNGTPISGATAQQYRPEGPDWHKHVSLRVTMSGAGFTTTTTTSNSALVHSGSIETSDGLYGVIEPGEVVRVGATLHAQPGVTGIPGLKARFEWLSEKGNSLIFTQGSTYTVKASDYGRSFAVLGHLSAPHLKPDGWLGEDYKVLPGLFTTHPVPLVSGSPTVGTTLQGTRGTYSPASGVSYSYRWFAQSSATATPVAIHGATAKSYRIPASVTGMMLTLRVTAHKKSYTSTLELSAPTAAVQ